MKTIAVVDDFKTNTVVYSTFLKQNGYKILSANLPSEALTIFNGQKIDLMICDYKMPEMTGAELVKKIKAKFVYQNLPVLIISSEKSTEFKQKAKEAGAFGWLEKPFEFKRLIRIIDNILK